MSDTTGTPQDGLVRRANGTMLPGHTANRRGRPLKARGMLTIFNELRDEKIELRVEGESVKMARMEAWVTNLWNRAISCDPEASAAVMAILRGSGQLDPEPSDGGLISIARPPWRR